MSKQITLSALSDELAQVKTRYKAHIGVDKDSGLVHHLKVTAANVHDVRKYQSF